MKKNLLLSLLFTIILLAGCKEEETTQEIKIIASGANYSVSITNGETGELLLDKPNQTGSNTYIYNTEVSCNVNLNNTGTLTVKIYLNNELKRDITRGSGSQAVSVN